jgi:carboxypeptidase Q
MSRAQWLCRWLAPAAAALAVPLLALAQGPSDEPDLVMYSRIRDEGLSRSRVVEYASELLDGIGPRLTGSPNLERATTWALDRLRQGGSLNVRRESWGEFGTGWRTRNVWARLLEPDTANVVAEAAPWSPATPGPVSGDIVRVRGFTQEAGFAPLRGTLRGKIVLLGRAPGAPDVVPIDRPLFERLSDEQLADIARQPFEARGDDQALERGFADAEFYERVSRFFAEEGVRAVLVPSANNSRGGASGGTLYSDWNYSLGMYAHQKARAMRVPAVVISVEAYNRLIRLLERKVAVRVEVNVDVEITGDQVEGFNVLAEIPGIDAQRGREVVMVTAHLDSWAVGTGATDDGAGVVIAMEAMRILNALEVRPRRTIQLALWTGEEQGALGSWAHVTRHVATVPLATTPEQRRLPEVFRQRVGPVTPKDGHARISAVYNLDQGSGKIRGVRLTGNLALRPIFERWIAPLRDLGATLVAARGGCASDCLSFERVGIPTPLFLQDPLDYTTRTLHTTSDTFDHLIPEDLRQAAVVTATMLYNTAMRDELLPRVPLAP